MQFEGGSLPARDCRQGVCEHRLADRHHPPRGRWLRLPEVATPPTWLLGPRWRTTESPPVGPKRPGSFLKAAVPTTLRLLRAVIVASPRPRNLLEERHERAASPQAPPAVPGSLRAGRLVGDSGDRLPHEAGHSSPIMRGHLLTLQDIQNEPVMACHQVEERLVQLLFVVAAAGRLELVHQVGVGRTRARRRGGRPWLGLGKRELWFVVALATTFAHAGDSWGTVGDKTLGLRVRFPRTRKPVDRGRDRRICPPNPRKPLAQAAIPL